MIQQQLNSCFVRRFYPNLVDFCQCVVGPEGEARTFIKQWGDFIFHCVRTMTRAATRERLLRCNLCFFLFSSLVLWINAPSALQPLPPFFLLLGWAASKKNIYLIKIHERVDHFKNQEIFIEACFTASTSKNKMKRKEIPSLHKQKLILSLSLHLTRLYETLENGSENRSYWQLEVWISACPGSFQVGERQWIKGALEHAGVAGGLEWSVLLLPEGNTHRQVYTHRPTHRPTHRSKGPSSAERSCEYSPATMGPWGNRVTPRSV